VLLRRLSLSHVDEPRKRYEGYDDNRKKDKRGQDHVCDDLSGLGRGWASGVQTL